MNITNSSLQGLAHQRSGPGAIAIFAAPLAWFAQLNIGYALATEPCFPTDQRLPAPDPRWAWTHVGLFAVAALCTLIALCAFASSLAALRRQSGPAAELSAAGSRNRFAALWAVAFGGGFLVATLITGVGLMLLPRCGG
jgi:hypothetical protein